MNILICGAGVIGSLYAARLREAGHRITVLARGSRLADIRLHGLVIEDIVTGRQSTVPVETTERLLPGDQYDVTIITVRLDQLPSLMPDLAANRLIPTMLFMLNNPIGSSKLSDLIGANRVLLGFPGAGGTRDGYVVRYAMIAQQPTTLGEWDGRRTERILRIADQFRAAGFPTKVSRNMDAWLKAHAFFVTAISGAIYLSGGDCIRLSKDNETLGLMADGVREGFTVVRALGLPVAPFPLKVLFCWLPKRFAVWYWRRFFASPMGDYVFGRHSRSASPEMRILAQDCKTLIERTGVEAPALHRLYNAIEAYAGQTGH